MADLVAELYDQELRNHAKGKLLDLGCGYVPLYQAYKDHITENICVDWANTLHANEYLDLVCDLSKDLPFKNQEFDTIILSDVLEHIPNPEDLCQEMSRVLAKDGKVFINVPFSYCIHESPHDFYRYTEFALKRFLERSNLKLVEFKSIGGSPEVFADFMSKHLQFIPLIGSPLAMFTQFITRLFGKTRLGKRLSSKTAEAFPLGYFLIATK